MMAALLRHAWLLTVFTASEPLLYDEIMLVVDDDVVTRKDIERELILSLVLNEGAAGWSMVQTGLQQELLSDAVNLSLQRHLILRQARKLAVGRVGEGEVEALLSRLRQIVGSDKGSLESLLARLDGSSRFLKRFLKEELIIRQSVQGRSKEDVKRWVGELKRTTRILVLGADNRLVPLKQK